MRSSVPVGGCVALSSWLPFKAEYPAAKTSASDNTKIFQAHGTADNVVQFTWGQGSHELLKTFMTISPEFLSIRGMAHSSHPTEMKAVDTFLNSVLTPL
jgi:lysophospholipase-1